MHTLTIPFAPYSEETCLSIECLILAEAAHTIFGINEGPIRNIILFAPWNDNFPNSELYPANKKLLSMANYWRMFIEFFYNKTQHQPLSLELLCTLKRELITRLEIKTNQSFYCNHDAKIYEAWNGINMFQNTTITFYRPFLEINPIPKPLGNQWLHLREQFDMRRAPFAKWSDENYLQKHKSYHEAYLKTQEDPDVNL